MAACQADWARACSEQRRQLSAWCGSCGKLPWCCTCMNQNIEARGVGADSGLPPMSCAASAVVSHTLDGCYRSRGGAGGVCGACQGAGHRRAAAAAVRQGRQHAGFDSSCRHPALPRPADSGSPAQWLWRAWHSPPLQLVAAMHVCHYNSSLMIHVPTMQVCTGTPGVPARYCAEPNTSCTHAQCCVSRQQQAPAVPCC